MHKEHYCAKKRDNVTHNLEILTLKKIMAIYDLTTLAQWNISSPPPFSSIFFQPNIVSTCYRWVFFPRKRKSSSFDEKMFSQTSYHTSLCLILLGPQLVGSMVAEWGGFSGMVAHV